MQSAIIEPFERLLNDVVARPSRQRVLETQTPPKAVTLDNLSSDKRKLLALRLRKKAAESHAVSASIWFPFVETGAGVRLRLFCFPYAGGGAAAFRSWMGHLGPGVAVSPARLPGRETRIGEPAITDIEHLITALRNAIVPFLDVPFAFFGHSMGAVIAFELAHALRRHNQSEPVCLIAAGARAPQFRLGHQSPPEPAEEEFLDEVRMREGTPAEVLENPDLLRFVLPALKADAALFRNYIYVPVPPLNCPVVAYGGTEDRNVSEAQVAAWREQTAGAFDYRMLPGGHFFIQLAGFVHTLAADVRTHAPQVLSGEPSGSIAGSEK